jgi:hypothetical protein
MFLTLLGKEGRYTRKGNQRAENLSDSWNQRVKLPAEAEMESNYPSSKVKPLLHKSGFLIMP